MLKLLERPIHRWFARKREEIPIRWMRRTRGAWLPERFKGLSADWEANAYSGTIERLASKTNQHGELPLWDGYPSQNLGPTRSPSDVRTTKVMGSFFATLVRERKPGIIVEFGTAFGVSGMYFLSGLEVNGSGKLLTFEPNGLWADIARTNLSAIGSRYHLTVGTFEDNIDKHLSVNDRIDIAFIDAIHRRDFVMPQLNKVVERSTPGAIVILDDINFSPDMTACWEEIALSEQYAASASFGERVGIIELAR